ncbi:COG3205 Predicted membrane protein [uncultured Caudovirales phage]|uniref:COG3205 Predicted membrane protein n=1 Tax=uncultured Caudovirales phage TaxID=2100421 RepID=A0A6J5MIE3_9CAUD|nr:COG3205 Predicted membrane protein [uncultured Caudovirales phage]CAB4150973.1 COG3205 Predicted membrane protein [uncultured Caudovirales phage]CAB4174778.1 COG3205 Predicted membrane protein [uncultured Caudovirales phage]CAB4179882.1 COG3205 Predicted membrane protein [uncultured Caudovirales phage]CAB4185552.1 COG3205 Predicted membrane protein [uncultured Caudovirales phage]
MKNKRILAKTVSWHIIHFIMVTVVALIVTHKIHLAASIASLEMLAETGIYFAHEKLWSKIK